jgi:SAM-dependent methyltransferase
MSFVSTQHDRWRDAMRHAWRRGALGPGQTILDLACGAGGTTIELAVLVGPTGRVRALDLSPEVIAEVRAAIHALTLTQAVADEADLDEVDLGHGTADAIWCRWAMGFVDDPIGLLERSYEALRPGGRFISHEYLELGSWRRAASSTDLDALVLAVSQSWREDGDEPPAGIEIPVWLDQIGFDLADVQVVSDGRLPGLAWQWPREFVELGLARLLAQDAITTDLAEEIRAAHDEREAQPPAPDGTPALLEVIAVRP